MKKLLLFLLILIPINIKACYESVSIPSGQSNRVNGHQGTCRAVIGASYNGTAEGSCFSGGCSSGIASICDLNGKLGFVVYGGFGVTTCTVYVSGSCMCDGSGFSTTMTISLAEWGFRNIKVENHPFDSAFKDADYDYNIVLTNENSIKLILSLNDSQSTASVTGPKHLNISGGVTSDRSTYEYTISGFKVGENKISIHSTDRNGNTHKDYVIHVIQKKVVPTTLQTITLAKESLTLSKGESFKLETELYPADLGIEELNWSSSNPSIASVDRKGVITGVGTGTTTITASYEGVSASLIVKVEANAKSIKFSHDRESLKIGEAKKLQYTIYPYDSINKNVSFSSSNPRVAVIDSEGTIKAVGTGTTVIQVKSEAGGHTATCIVTVKKGIESILTSYNTLELGIYESVPVTAIIYPKDASEQDVTWFVYNDSIAIVSEDGVVTGLKEGTTKVVAKADGVFSDEVVVTVKANKNSNGSKTSDSSGGSLFLIIITIIAIAGVAFVGYKYKQKNKIDEI